MSPTARSVLFTWLRHVLFGIPIAAALHTALQTAADPVPRDDGLVITLLHFSLGVVVGSVILAPAFSLQALVSIGLAKLDAGPIVQVAVGGIVQAVLVSLWAAVVGIEPSLPGRFPLTWPMIGAGFVAGATVAAIAAHRRPMVGRQS